MDDTPLARYDNLWKQDQHNEINSLRPSDHHWFRKWLVAWPAPSHYLNQCWVIVNWTFRNKLQWNLNGNSNILIQENAFESVVCETAAILSRPQCIKANIGTRSDWVILQWDTSALDVHDFLPHSYALLACHKKALSDLSTSNYIIIR